MGMRGGLGAPSRVHRVKAAGPPVAETDPADKIRQKVAFARQHAPHIAADAAERWVAEGITPDQASARLYELINEPIEASKIVGAYRAARGIAG